MIWSDGARYNVIVIILDLLFLYNINSLKIIIETRFYPLKSTSPLNKINPNT